MNFKSPQLPPRRAAATRVARIASVGIGYFALLPFPAASEQAPSAKPPERSSTEQVPIEVFEAPTIKHLVHPPYPSVEEFRYGEGWVDLSFMVDPTGKPSEIAVTGSTGDKKFEQIAVEAIEHSQQLEGLQRAIAGRNGARHLSKDLFGVALRALLGVGAQDGRIRRGDANLA